MSSQKGMIVRGNSNYTVRSENVDKMARKDKRRNGKKR